MSDTPLGPGWWQASDGKWYHPNQHPSAVAARSTTAVAPTPGAAGEGTSATGTRTWPYAAEPSPSPYAAEPSSSPYATEASSSPYAAESSSSPYATEAPQAAAGTPYRAPEASPPYAAPAQALPAAAAAGAWWAPAAVVATIGLVIVGLSWAVSAVASFETAPSEWYARVFAIAAAVGWLVVGAAAAMLARNGAATRGSARRR